MNKLQLFSHIIIIASIGWIVWMISPEISSLLLYTSDIHYSFIPVTLGIGVFAHIFHIYGFQSLLQAHQEKPVNILTTARFWSGSQIARYLPGRIFGIAYQLSLAEKEINKIALVHANISFMYIDILSNTSLAAAIFFFYYDYIWISLIIIAISFISALYIAPEKIVNTGIIHILRLFPHLENKIIKQNLTQPISDKRAISIGFISNMIAILFNLFSWWSLLYIFPLLPKDNMVILWCCYMLAWIIGFIIILIPAGLGIRENVFIYLGKMFVSTPVLVALSIIARIWFILIDIVLYILVFLIYQLKKESL